MSIGAPPGVAGSRAQSETENKHQSFVEGAQLNWAGVDNLEERVDGAESIDPIVLEALREVSSE